MLPKLLNMLKYTQRQILEKKLINDFKEDFYTKIGYYPLVTVRVDVREENNSIKIMSLEELEEYFIECFPKVMGKPLNIRQKARYRELVDIRSLFAFFARAMRYKVVAIGKFLGNKDHTTILHYITLFNNQMETNQAYRELYRLIFNHIKEKTNKHESSTLDHLDQAWLKSEPTLFPGLL